MRLYEYFKNCAVIIKQSFLEPIFLVLSCVTVEATDDKWYPIQNVWGKDCEVVVAMYVIYHSRQQERSTNSLTLIPCLGFMANGLWPRHSHSSHRLMSSRQNIKLKFLHNLEIVVTKILEKYKDLMEAKAEDELKRSSPAVFHRLWFWLVYLENSKRQNVIEAPP